MKKLINYIVIALLFISGSLYAQVDINQMPEPGPAPAVNLGQPQTFELKNGLKVLVVEDKKLPRVLFNLTIDNDPYAEGDKIGTGALFSDMMGTGTEKTPKDDFEDEVEFMGATLELFGSGAYASGLSKYSDRLLEMMAEAIMTPKFDQDQLDKFRDQNIEGLKANAKSASSIANKVRSALAFGKEHPFGEFETIEGFENVTLEDIQEYYETFYVPGNSYLIVSGDVEFKKVRKKIKKLFKKWDGEEAPSETYPVSDNVTETEINFVDVPNAVQAEVHLINTTNLKMTDDDYFPVLLANQIVGGSFESYLNKTLREDKAWTYGARTSLPARKEVTSFRASTSGKMAVTDSIALEMIKQINRIRNEQVEEDLLANAKATYSGNFIREASKPRNISNFALRIQTQDLPEDFYENYLENINKVTVEDVQRVANKYFLTDQARIVIAAKGSEVANALEATGIPVKYFDKDANPVDKPEFSKPIPEGVTLETVYNNYIEAIGGKKAAEAVKNVVMLGSASIQGMALNMEMKMTKDGKSAQEVKMGGNVLQKMVFDGEKGYNMAQGQKMDYSEEEIEAAKKSAGIFAELTVPEGAELKNIQDFEGQDAYVVQLTDEVKEFYSVDSGYKLFTETTIQQGDQDFTTTVKYDDYQEVDGVKFPFTMINNIGQEFKIEFKEIKLNQKLSDADFK